jgi:hypothetical protein
MEKVKPHCSPGHICVGPTQNGPAYRVIAQSGRGKSPSLACSHRPSMVAQSILVRRRRGEAGRTPWDQGSAVTQLWGVGEGGNSPGFALHGSGARQRETGSGGRDRRLPLAADGWGRTSTPMGSVRRWRPEWRVPTDGRRWWGTPCDGRSNLVWRLCWELSPGYDLCNERSRG